MMKAALAWIVLLAAIACAQQEPDSQLPPIEGIGETPTPAYNYITRDEANERIQLYLALTAWAEATEQVARNHTEDFRKIFFSTPDRECVISFRQDQVAQPDLPPDALFQCVMRGIRGQDDGKWSSMSRDEREARTRRTYILLSGSIDPPEYLAVSIAANRGIRVTSRNDPEFAELKGHYQTCHELGQQMALGMGEMTDPEAMSVQWLEDADGLKECFTDTTSRIYELGPKEDEDEPAAGTDP